MNDETKPMPSNKVDAFLTRKNIETAVNRHRNDRQLQFVGQSESTSAELRHMPSEGSSTFWKDHKRNTVLQDFPSLFVRLMYGFWPTLIDKDVASTLASFSHEGNVPETLLHHPVETASQKAVDEEDVVGPLMVGNEDVGLLLVQQLSSLNFNRQEHHPAHQPAPNHCRIITPGSRLAKCATDDGDNSCQGCCYDDDWQGDKELVKSVKKFHGISTPSLFLGILSLS